MADGAIAKGLDAKGRSFVNTWWVYGRSGVGQRRAAHADGKLPGIERNAISRNAFLEPVVTCLYVYIYIYIYIYIYLFVPDLGNFLTSRRRASRLEKAVEAESLSLGMFGYFVNQITEKCAGGILGGFLDSAVILDDCGRMLDWHFVMHILYNMHSGVGGGRGGGLRCGIWRLQLESFRVERWPDCVVELGAHHVGLVVPRPFWPEEAMVATGFCVIFSCLCGGSVALRFALLLVASAW